MGTNSKISIIIPTMGDGKPVLEHCLYTFNEHVNTDNMELIVVDNASIDDTFAYLEQLVEDGFMNCQAITNKQNLGFAKSVNQGIDLASGEYICVMHNDLIFDSDPFPALVEAFDKNPGYGILGIATNDAFSQAQLIDPKIEEDVQELPFVDSFFMLFPAKLGLRFDEGYDLAYFEDRDLSFDCRSREFKVGFLPSQYVEHRYATTTRVLALDPDSNTYWKNAAYFTSKWANEGMIPDALLTMPVINQLIQIEEVINPKYPEKDWVHYITRILTKEEITKLHSADLSPELLQIITRLLMIIDDRPLLRRFEDRLLVETIPIFLAREMAEYYFSKNIYSRAQLYLSAVKPVERTLPFKVLEAQLLVEDRDFDNAVEVINELIRLYPYHPELFKLSGDIHKHTGNMEEAHSFYHLAEQIDPVKYGSERFSPI